jgi:hypothetical protein
MSSRKRRRASFKNEVRRALEHDLNERQAAFDLQLADAAPNWTTLLSLHLQMRELEFLMERLDEDVGPEP